METRLILASSSPRRNQLMLEAGYDFEVIPPDDSAEDCSSCTGSSPAELVAELAFRKASNVAKKLDFGLIIAADTVAECHGQILGKPRDVEHAEQMLRLMSGHTHRVLTGVCLWDRPSDRKLLEVESTDLLMESISENALKDHLDSDNWIGKAGAFGFQDGMNWVRVTAGNVSNVVGLPMERLSKMIEKITRPL